MKTSSMPAVRLPPKLRHAVEELLRDGETSSGFVEEAIRRNFEFRQAQRAFIERGFASSEAAAQSGKYIAASAVLRKIARRINKASKIAARSNY